MITCKGKLGDRSEFPTHDEGMIAGIFGGEKVTLQYLTRLALAERGIAYETQQINEFLEQHTGEGDLQKILGIKQIRTSEGYLVWTYTTKSGKTYTEGQTIATFDIKKALLFGGLIVVGIIILRRFL